MREDFFRFVGEVKQAIKDNHVETREAISNREAGIQRTTSEIFLRLGEVKSAVDKHIGEKNDGD